MRSLLLLTLSLLAGVSGVSMTRRALANVAAAAAASSSAAICSRPAVAAQRGAENPYANQLFDDVACTKRSLLGSCQDFGAPSTPGAQPPVAFKQLQQQPDPAMDSAIVQSLLKKTADNAEKNAQLVKEKTIKADQGATFGPFAKDAPIMRADGSFDVVPLAKYDRLKDRGKITQTATGLDKYVAGFDPDAPEPQREKIFGLF